ncbi:hypothetical protein NFJ02_06g128320 [Pycnococcus provasolii]
MRKWTASTKHFRLMMYFAAERRAIWSSARCILSTNKKTPRELQREVKVVSQEVSPDEAQRKAAGMEFRCCEVADIMEELQEEIVEDNGGPGSLPTNVQAWVGTLKYAVGELRRPWQPRAPHPHNQHRVQHAADVRTVRDAVCERRRRAKQAQKKIKKRAALKPIENGTAAGVASAAGGKNDEPSALAAAAAAAVDALFESDREAAAEGFYSPPSCQKRLKYNGCQL